MFRIELWGRVVVPFLLNMGSCPIQYVFHFRKLRGEVYSGGGGIRDYIAEKGDGALWYVRCYLVRYMCCFRR